MFGSFKSYAPKKEKSFEEVIKEELTAFKGIEYGTDQTNSPCFQPPGPGLFRVSKNLSNSKLRYRRIGPLCNPDASQQEMKTDPIKDNNMFTFPNPTSFPQSVHGVIIIRETEDESTTATMTARWGSGIMISKDLVLTAACNVYNNEKPIRKRYPYLRFVSAAAKDEAPFEEIEIDDIYAPESYVARKREKDVENESNEVDIDDSNYALLVLKKPIGTQTGYFGVCAVADPKILVERDIYIAGYPEFRLQEEEHKENENARQFEQWQQEGKITEYDEKKGLIHYQLDIPAVAGGLIGSGIFCKQGKNQYYVVGVHVGTNGNSNKACLITKEKFGQLYKWVERRNEEIFEAAIQGKDDRCSIKRLNLSECNLNSEPRMVKKFLEYKGLEEISFGSGCMPEKLIKELNENSKWGNLQTLELTSNKIEKEFIQVLGSNTSWKNLKVLILSRNDLKEGVIDEIVKLNNFPTLEEIDLSDCEFGNEGAVALSKNTSWTNLKALDLTGNDITEEGGAALGKNLAWSNLMCLRLRRNRIGSQGALAIANNPTWKNLRMLDIELARIDDEAAAAIGANTIWTHLEELILRCNDIGSRGASVIGSNVTWKRLTVLDLSRNEIGDDGAAAIGANTSWAYLEELNLSSNRIGKKGAIVISSNSTWNNLKVFNLSINAISDEGGAAIGMNVSWGNLEQLRLSDCSLGDKSAHAIGSNSTWRNLKVLDLSINAIGDTGGASIGNNTSWERLEQLLLRSNELGNRSAAALARNAAWSNLEELNLRLTSISDEGWAEIGRNTSWKKLRVLEGDLGGTQMGWKSAITIGRNSAWRHVEKITIYEFQSAKNERKSARRALFGKNSKLNFVEL